MDTPALPNEPTLPDNDGDETINELMEKLKLQKDALMKIMHSIEKDDEPGSARSVSSILKQLKDPKLSNGKNKK